MIANNSSISIEFGHFSFEETLNNLIARLESETKIINSLTKKYSNCPIHKIVLVDDYNNNIHSKHSDAYKQYLNIISKLGVKTLGFESRFSEMAANFIAGLKLEKFYEQAKNITICYAKYKNFKIKLYSNSTESIEHVEMNKYSCSVLTACWYLCRLKVLTYPEKSLYYLDDTLDQTSEFSSNYLVNVLPDRYRKVEYKTRALLFNSQYRKALPQIRNFFYENALC